jgi:hypothetical protein
MAFSTQYILSQDPAFQGKVQIAMHQAAVAVSGEERGDMTHQEWSKRAALAASVLRDPPETWVEQFSLAVAQNEAVDGQVDSDILFTVNAVWPDMAGVTGQDIS